MRSLQLSLLFLVCHLTVTVSGQWIPSVFSARARDKHAKLTNDRNDKVGKVSKEKCDKPGSESEETAESESQVVRKAQSGARRRTTVGIEVEDVNMIKFKDDSAESKTQTDAEATIKNSGESDAMSNTGNEKYEPEAGLLPDGHELMAHIEPHFAESFAQGNDVKDTQHDKVIPDTVQNQTAIPVAAIEAKRGVNCLKKTASVCCQDKSKGEFDQTDTTKWIHSSVGDGPNSRCITKPPGAGTNKQVGAFTLDKCNVNKVCGIECPDMDTCCKGLFVVKRLWDKMADCDKD